MTAERRTGSAGRAVGNARAGLERFDLVIVGAGPAGSAAALAALRTRPAARVLLLDRSPLGRDKVCGDGIAPHAVAQLAALGVDAVRPDELVPTVRLVSPSGTGSAAVARSPGYVVTRRVFDERLARAAIAAGAEFVEERVTAVERDDTGVTVNGRWRTPVVIAADGSNSVVRRLVGQAPNRGAALAVALRGYAPTPEGFPRELVLRWDSRRAGGLCYAWAFPVSDGTTNVGYGMSSAAAGSDGADSAGGRAELEERMRVLLPEFALDGVRLRGHTLPLTVSRPASSVGRILLTGDAASLINPLTGEGIFTALASGALAGTAAIDNPATAGRVYSARLRRQFGRQFRQLRVLYPLIDYRSVLDVVIRACERDPRMFDRLLDVGLGDSSFGVADVLRFVRLGVGRPTLSRA